MLCMYCFLLSLMFHADANILIHQTGCLSDTTCNCNTDINITCTIIPYKTGMSWKVSGTTVFECTLSNCATYNAAYASDYNTTAGIFSLNLSPMTIHHDQVEFRCTGDGSEYDSFTPDVVVHFQNDDYIVGSERNGTMDKLYVKTKTCVSSPERFTFEWKATQSEVLGDDTYDYPVTPNNVVNCTFTANSNCERNGSTNISNSIVIPAEQQGEPHNIFVVVTQDGNSDKTQIRIPGSFNIKDGKTSSSTVGTTPTHSSEKTDGNVSSLANNTITKIPFENSTYFTATNITKTDVYVMHESFTYLIVGGGLLFVLLVSCVIHVVYISVKGKARCDIKPRQHINLNIEANVNRP